MAAAELYCEINYIQVFLHHHKCSDQKASEVTNSVNDQEGMDKTARTKASPYLPGSSSCTHVLAEAHERRHSGAVHREHKA